MKRGHRTNRHSSYTINSRRRLQASETGPNIENDAHRTGLITQRLLHDTRAHGSFYAIWQAWKF